MSPNIYERGRTPVIGESKMTKKTISLCNSLNLDLTKVHRTTKDHQVSVRFNYPEGSTKKISAQVRSRSLRYSTIDSRRSTKNNNNG